MAALPYDEVQQHRVSPDESQLRQLQPVQTTYRLADLAPAAGKPASTTAPPVLDLRSHDAMIADFEAGLDGFAPWNGDQSAELTTVPGPKKNTVLQAVNCNSGGDFGIRVPMTGKHLERIDTPPLMFKYLPASGSTSISRSRKALSVIISLRFRVFFGRPAQPAWPWRFEGFEAGQWSRQLPAGRGSAPPFPGETPDSGQHDIGMLHEGYLNAGLGGNRRRSLSA